VLRILIVENQLLLGAGLQNLLSDEADLDVIGISPRNQLELVREIRQRQPDIVFLDEDSHLTDAIDLLTFLEDFHELQLIVVNANDHVVRIFNKQEIRLSRSTALFGIIRKRNFND